MAQTVRAALPNPYRLKMFRAPDPVMQRGLKVAAAVGVAILAAVYLAPKRAPEMAKVQDIPDRFAKLILEEPKKEAPPKVALPKPPEVVIKTPEPPRAKENPRPEAVPKPKPVAKRRQVTKPVAADAGTAGRERAKKEVAQLEKVSESLDKVLTDVSASLASTSDGKKERKTRKRRTRSGRGAAQVASLTPAAPSLDVAGSSAAIGGGSRIEVESLAEAGLPAPEATRADGSTAGRNEIRSDADLLAVVRKYAPGIRFCYDNELKKDPSLGGKLIVSITVAASGRVTGTSIVTDTVRSSAMTACAIAQIEAWKFGRVPSGVVTFQAPFVFTPPE